MLTSRTEAPRTVLSSGVVSRDAPASVTLIATPPRLHRHDPDVTIASVRHVNAISLSLAG